MGLDSRWGSSRSPSYRLIFQRAPRQGKCEPEINLPVPHNPSVPRGRLGADYGWKRKEEIEKLPGRSLGCSPTLVTLGRFAGQVPFWDIKPGVGFKVVLAGGAPGHLAEASANPLSRKHPSPRPPGSLRFHFSRAMASA